MFSKLISKAKTKLLAKLFNEWVSDEWDLQTLRAVDMMIRNREQYIKTLLMYSDKIEIKGFR